MNYRDDLRGVRAAITGGTSGLGLALMDNCSCAGLEWHLSLEIRSVSLPWLRSGPAWWAL